MVFPIGDDNTGRVRTPYVTYPLIAINVLVFVFFQGMGNNERFTYAFSTVPEEIRTGQDIARLFRWSLAARETSFLCSRHQAACTAPC